MSRAKRNRGDVKAGSRLTVGARMVNLAGSLGCLLFLAAPGDAGAQRAAPWSLRTVDGVSGAPVDGVRVAFPAYSATSYSDEDGMVPGHGARGTVRVLVARLGYADVDTLLAVPRSEDVRELRLQRAAVALPSLTVAAERGMTSRELQRIMFEREVAVGAIGVTRAEVEAVPPMGEADVFRSLQSFAGVSSVNDLTGQLFVRGGGSDQVAVYMDGAPVFGPFHMLGLFGAFNPDVVESTEFYRSSIPARYGGALSGVLSSTQRAGGASRTSVRGGISLLGLRAAADGSLPWGDVRWIAAGRRASVDVAPLGMPYSFQDVNLGLQAHVSENHRLRGSFFASTDRFEWDSWGAEAYGSASSDWSNLAASVSWSWVRSNRLNSGATAYYSRYRGNRTEGAVKTTAAIPSTTNGIEVAGLQAGVTVRGERSGFRAGVALEGGPVELRGPSGGGYVDEGVAGSYLHGSVFAEAERWIGPVRLAPGVRAGAERRRSRTFVEPRLSLRWQASKFAVSASLDRSYQFMSVLRDAYSMVPGARMWFLHDEKQPESVADGASLALDTWKGEEWTATITGWARRFRDVPHWRPVRSRDFAEMQFHDGSAHGVEATVQKHAGPIRGWISYQWAQVRFADDADATYYPQWDRRHEGEGVLTAEVTGRLTLSFRGTIGSGAPFWFPAGTIGALRYDPSQQSVGPVDYLGGSDQVTIWSNAQGRVPLYARYDSTHHSVRVETADNMSRVELRDLAVAIYKETSNEGDWRLVAVWEGDGRTSLCYSYRSIACIRLEASLEPGAVYKVEARADGRATASGTTTVVGDFQVEEAEMTGKPGGRAIRASWTESTATYRYLMALRRRDEFCANCTQAWYRDLEGTSYDGPVPQSAVDSAGAEPVLDVMALDEHFHAYLHSGHEGNFSSVQPVQNVVGGFGLVGSATYRSRKIDWKR